MADSSYPVRPEVIRLDDRPAAVRYSAAPPLEHLSYSSIMTYLDCPAAWRRKYIAKEPTSSTPALVFGSAFHSAIEEYLTAPAATGPVVHWAGAWGKALERDQAVDWGTDTPEQHFNEGIRLLSHKTIIEAAEKLTVRRDDQGPMIERRIELHVPGVPIPVIGYIDLVAADGAPCDLKTSGKSWSDGQAASSLQGLFYLAALNQADQHWHDWRFRHIVFVKTKDPKVQVFESVHAPKAIFFLFKLIADVWQAIEQGVFPVNPTSWKCSAQYCDFWAQCRGRYV